MWELGEVGAMYNGEWSRGNAANVGGGATCVHRAELGSGLIWGGGSRKRWIAIYIEG